MNEERFLDLAMKEIGGQSSDIERTELNAVLAVDQERRAQFAALRRDIAVAKEVLPLVEATSASAGQLPGYAHERLQTKVRQTLGRPELDEKKRAFWNWRWFLALAPVAALFILLLWPAAPAGTVVQLAMLDTLGPTRGSDNGDAAALQSPWPDSKPEVFSSSTQLDAWEKTWPGAPKATVVKIIYDRAAGELRVLGRKPGGEFRKTFQVATDLGSALKQVEEYVAAETAR